MGKRPRGRVASTCGGFEVLGFTFGRRPRGRVASTSRLIETKGSTTGEGFGFRVQGSWLMTDCFTVFQGHVGGPHGQGGARDAQEQGPVCKCMEADPWNNAGIALE